MFFVTLCLTITIGKTSVQSSESESMVPTLSPSPFDGSNDHPNDDSIWAILGPVLGVLGIVLLCAMGCWMQHKEYMFELQTRRRP